MFKGEHENGDSSLVVALSAVEDLSVYIDELKIRIHKLFKQTALREGLSELTGVINGMEKIIKGMRLSPLDTALYPLHALVRDINGKLGKKARVILSCPLLADRGLGQLILEILFHIVRNAIDHGIETPEERKSLGKDETGMIRIQATKAEGSIIITVTDDGRGIDEEAVRERAKEMGLDSETDLVSVLMAPGFSMRKTADQSQEEESGLIWETENFKNCRDKGPAFNISV